MSFLGWTAAVGGLLLLMSLASGWIHRSPVTTFGLYLAAGVACGLWPVGAGFAARGYGGTFRTHRPTDGNRHGGLAIYHRLEAAHAVS